MPIIFLKYPNSINSGRAKYDGKLSRLGSAPLNLTTYGQALRFVLFVGAAMHDATPEQREVLDKKVRPLLEFYRSTGREAAVRSAHCHS